MFGKSHNFQKIPNSPGVMTARSCAHPVQRLLFPHYAAAKPDTEYISFTILASLIKTTGQTAQLTDQFSLTHQFYDCFLYDASRRYW